MTTSTSGPADAARVPWPRSRRGELALILVVALAQVGGTTLAATHQTGTIGVGGYLLLGGAVLVLFGRQRYPVGVLLASCSLTLAYSVSRGPRGPIYFALIAASVSAVVAGKRRVVIGVLIVGYVAFQWLPPLVGTHPGPSALAAFLVGAWLLVLWLGAEWIRGRALRLAALARSREEEARRLASDERLRIARELHDVLAHDISLINVQASSALHLIDRQPERAREALAAIKEVSKEALVELRSVLGVLRQVDEAAPLSPAPSLDRLDELLARTETTGLQLRLECPDDPVPRPLPSAVDQAAYRIVQEALTNVTRHARATTATVRITRSAGHLVVEVEDDGATAAVPGNGHGGTGIAGMRERATALGGNLQAGGRPTGGLSRPGLAPSLIRVLLADDQALVRAGFAALLDAEDDIEVIAQAADGNEAFRLAQSARPDVVLMDIRMPGADGLEATRRIVADDGLAGVHVVILTTFELDEYVFEALRAGASGFLVKDTEPAELIRAVRVVASGEGLLSPGVTRTLIAEFATRSRDTSAAPDARLVTLLTEREKEVVTLVGSGLSNEDIAQRLFLSPNTAKTHTSRAMIKLGARDRAQLVVFAYESGLVRPGWTT